MAELADALDSGSSEGNFMQVQVLFPAPVRVFVETLGFLLGQVSVMNIGTSESVFMDALLFSPIDPACQNVRFLKLFRASQKRTFLPIPTEL